MKSKDLTQTNFFMEYFRVFMKNIPLNEIMYWESLRNISPVFQNEILILPLNLQNIPTTKYSNVYFMLLLTTNVI